MEECKVAKKQFSKLGLMFFLGTLIIYAAQLAIVMVVRKVKPEWTTHPDMGIIISILPLYLIGMPLLIMLVKKVPAINIERRKMKPGAFVIAAIMCFAVMYISNIVGNVITIIISLLKGGAVQNVVMQMTNETSLWLIILYMVICAPIMEEYIFRKLIVDRTARFGQGVAIVTSGLMFGLFHGNLNQFAYAFTLGIFLAYLYVKTGNIKITIALHMMINFVGGFISTILMRVLDLEEMNEALSSPDMQVMMDYMMNNLGGLIAYMIFAFFVFGMMIAGGILLIVNLCQKKFVLAKGEVEIPKGKKFSAVMLNVGMILYSIFWIVMIVVQLFS